MADSTKKSIGIAFLVALVASILVSSTAVFLKPIQENNKALEKKKNVLIAAGLYKEGVDINSEFKKVKAVVIDLTTGKEAKDINVEKYDMKAALKDPATTIALSPDKDIAKIKNIPKYSIVYLMKQNGNLTKIILPIYGKGLWSTMYAFIALDKDLNTIKGLTFYEHGETPGLGGEIDNPKWKSIWVGKKAFKDNEVAIRVIKGSVDTSRKEAIHQIDGLSGATLTSVGVSDTVRFWLGEAGYGKYLSQLKQTMNPAPSEGGNE